jgi:hypothetical protein
MATKQRACISRFWQALRAILYTPRRTLARRPAASMSAIEQNFLIKVMGSL